MRREQPELHPPFINRRWRRPFKAPNIRRPENIARKHETETAAEGLGHGFEGAFAVAAPVDGEGLAAWSGAASEEEGVGFSETGG